jgi:small neutral amino acid transporter SnatA (MarC family)
VNAFKFGLAAFIAIFPIVNPVRSVPSGVVDAGEPLARRREQARRAVLFMTSILVVSYFAGSAILNFFSISRPRAGVGRGRSCLPERSARSPSPTG